MEYKIMPALITKRMSSGAGKLAGYGATWDLDRANERCVPGCFSKHLSHLTTHGWLAASHSWTDLPIGMITAAEEDERGLYIEATFHNTKAAQNWYTIASERIARGKRQGLSVGYTVLKDRWGPDGVRELLDVKVEEISLVTVAANPAAHVGTVSAKQAPTFSLLRPYVAKGEEVEGLFCVYGVVDAYGDRHHPGMFAQVTPSQVGWYFRHDDSYGELARVKGIWEVTRRELPGSVQARFPEATGGAVIVREYFDTENGRDALAWANEKGMGLSPRYIVLRSTTRWEGSREVRDIWEVDLAEVSDTDHPAIPGVKSYTGNARFSLLKGRYER